MPNRRAHRSWTSWLLGDDYNEVHAAIDRPVKRHPGRMHRRYNHDFISAVRTGCRAARRKNKSCIIGALAGLIHISQDAIYAKPRRKKNQLFPDFFDW